MIAIVDYEMGNLRSVQKGFEKVGAHAEIVATAEQIARADKLVLPGVGAFRDAISHLRERELIEPILESIRQGRPFLGICLGMQLLLDVSFEDGEHAGLGLIPGEVVRFNFDDLPNGHDLKIPHMGWNQLRWDRPCPLLNGLTSGENFYFVHSYYVRPTEVSWTNGLADYGRPFTAMVWKDNVFATQFHPEKSQAKGLKILENFAAY